MAASSLSIDRRAARFLARVCLAAVLASTLAPRPASADLLLAPFAGIKFKGDTTLYDLDEAADKNKLVFGGSVMWLGDGPLGIEGEVAFIPGYFNADRSLPLVQSSFVTTVMGNAVLTVPRPWVQESLRPYVSGGFGVLRARMEDQAPQLLAFKRTMGAFNLGGGVTGFVGRTRRVGFRWDVRYVRAAGAIGAGNDPASFGSERLKLWRATMAVLIRY